MTDCQLFKILTYTELNPGLRIHDAYGRPIDSQDTQFKTLNIPAKVHCNFNLLGFTRTLKCH